MSNTHVRKAVSSRRFTADAKCASCGFEEPAALQGNPKRPVCYECGATKEGRITVEGHHPLGRDVDPGTVSTPGNMHRVLSDAQIDWPPPVRANTGGDPLLWVAALVRFLRDAAAFIEARAGRVATWLERCADALRDRYGPEWWKELGLPRLWEDSDA